MSGHQGGSRGPPGDLPPGPSGRLHGYHRWLLRLYHPAFRARHADEMARLFAERWQDTRGPWARVRFLAGATADAFAAGLGTRLDAHRHRDGRRRRREGGPRMDGIARDLRYALRTLARSPGFTLVATLTLALGIGANTAIFSVVRGVLMAPLPYDDPHELVSFYGLMTARDVDDFPFSPPDFQDFRERSELIDEMAAVFTFSQPITGQGDPVQVETGLVTPEFFRVLGVAPALGRDFRPEEGIPNEPGVGPGAPGAHPTVVILTHGLWTTHFGGDVDALGSTLELGGIQAEIVGVLPEDFELLIPPGLTVQPDIDLYTTARLDYANAPRNNMFLRPIARLRDGATLAQAQAEIDRIAADIAAEGDGVTQAAGYGVRLEPLAADLTAGVRPLILALVGAVAFVLLIACANVANLLLVRASGRAREIAVRSALGGDRRRIVQQLLMESGALALGGAVVGVAVAWVGVDLLLALVPADLPRADQVGIDGAVLAFTLAAAAGAALLFGLAPALQASRTDVAEALKDRGAPSAARGQHRLRNLVVVGEVALSTVLLIGAGLMVRSFVELTRVDPGFEAEGVLALEIPLPFARYPESADRDRVMTALQERLAALPGAQSASATYALPFTGEGLNGRYGHEEALADATLYRQAAYIPVRPDYFETLGIPVLEGRPLTRADHVDSAAVAVVDERLARRNWPDASAVGQRVLIRTGAEPEWIEIVGVVPHQRTEDLAAEGGEQIFLPDRFMGDMAAAWVVRAQGDAAELAPAVREAVDAVDPGLALAGVRPLMRDVERAMAPTTFALTLIGLFGALAVALSLVGLYGVLAYVVGQRRAEFGVRMAFGARAESIVGLVVRQGLGLAGVGLALGLVGAYLLSGLMASLVVGVTPTDPLTYVGITGLFAVGAAGACLVPALRATRMDPGAALREE